MNFRAFNANPKTTWVGVLTGLSVIIGGLAATFGSESGFDLREFLAADGVAQAIVSVIAGIGIGILGYVARDADKSSQDSNVRLPVKPEAVDTNAISDATTDAAVDQSLGRR